MKSNATAFQKYFIAIICFSLILLITSCSSSKKNILNPADWLTIGETKANFVREKDVIKVYSIDKFTDIRFRVEDRAVKISDMTIYYENGDKLSPNIDEVIEPGAYSRIINLADNGKKLDRIEFKYRTTGSVLKGRSKIILLGKPYSENNRKED